MRTVCCLLICLTACDAIWVKDERLDADGDGAARGLDCDDEDPAVGAGLMWYADADDDGYGDPENTISSCAEPGDGYVANADDCDDDDPESPTLQTRWYADADGDGWGSCADAAPATYTDCPDEGGREGRAPNSWDCDDSVKDGMDKAPRAYRDSDGDGYGNEADWSTCAAPGDEEAGDASVCPGTDPGWVNDSTDCDDKNLDISPAKLEDCTTTADDDCSGEVNDEVHASSITEAIGQGAITCYIDCDKDGHGRAWEWVVSTVTCATDKVKGKGKETKAHRYVCPPGNDSAQNTCAGLGGPDGASYSADSIDCEDVSTLGQIRHSQLWFLDVDKDGYAVYPVCRDDLDIPDSADAEGAESCAIGARIISNLNCADCDGAVAWGTQSECGDADDLIMAHDAYVQEDCDDSNSNVYPDCPYGEMCGDDPIDRDCDATTTLDCQDATSACISVDSGAWTCETSEALSTSYALFEGPTPWAQAGHVLTIADDDLLIGAFGLDLTTCETSDTVDSGDTADTAGSSTTEVACTTSENVGAMYVVQEAMPDTSTMTSYAPGDTMSETYTIQGAAADDRFGWAIATGTPTDGTTPFVTVSAPRWDGAGDSNQKVGAVYIFTRDELDSDVTLDETSSTWYARIVGATPAAGETSSEALGTGLDVINLNGTDYLLVGSPYKGGGLARVLQVPVEGVGVTCAAWSSSADSRDSSCVGSDDTDHTVAAVYVSSGISYAPSLGTKVINAGDLDDDEVPDIAISATTLDYEYATYETDEDKKCDLDATTLPTKPCNSGGIVVCSGAALTGDLDASSSADCVVIWGEEQEWRLGSSLAAAGDVDADGYADLLVRRAGEDSEGVVYLISGAKLELDGADQTITAVASVTFTGQPNDELGTERALATAGDMDGDGGADLLIGAPGADLSTDGKEGAAWLIPSSALLDSDLALGDAAYTLDVTAPPDGFIAYVGEPADYAGGAVLGGFHSSSDGVSDLLLVSSRYRDDYAGAVWMLWPIGD